MLIEEAVSSVAVICALVAVVECAADDGSLNGGLRTLCGAMAASAIMQSVAEWIREIF